MHTGFRLFRYLGKYWRTTAIAYVCLLLVAVVELTVPNLVQRVIDCAIQGASGAQGGRGCPAGVDAATLAGQAVLILLGLTVLKSGLNFGQGFLGQYGAQGIAFEVRNEIYRKLQKLPFGWHDRAETGQLMARATSDVEQLRNFTGRGFLQLGQLVYMVGGISIVLFLTNWKLALASMVVVPPLVRAVQRYNTASRPLFYEVQENIALLASIVQENLAGARVVKAFARELEQKRRFDRQNDILEQEYLGAAEVQSFGNPLMDVLGNMGLVSVLWFGGYLIIAGDLSVGQLVAFNAYVMLLVRPVKRLGFLINQSSRAIAAGDRIFEILDAKIDIEDAPNAEPLPPVQGRVTFDHVWVSYYGGDPVLRDVSFEALPGQVVALLGMSGSGKTTTINLVPRFYDPSAGRVLIDGHDVKEVQIQSLRRQIGMVLQDTTLFTGTIRDNIIFGVPGATEGQITAAARAARAHDFIAGFPDGYDTRVGERGVTLSGGQKQRIAIARALLLNPRILILDDFTSAVDTETEALIREALDVLMKGRTTLIIAQRVSTVQYADQIVVLDQGEIAGIGTHQHLLETNPIYAEIYHLQLTDESVAAVAEEVDQRTPVPAGGWSGRGGDGSGRRRPDSGVGTNGAER
ncbi:MAG: ABC transporter ATP-binding protein [Chloroflexi bacterium]|nr:ABC transporter ATP-binding protein [Chloroflexota bacterium]